MSIVSFKLAKESCEIQRGADSPKFVKKPLEYYDECDGFGSSSSESSSESLDDGRKRTSAAFGVQPSVVSVGPGLKEQKSNQGIPTPI